MRFFDTLNEKASQVLHIKVNGKNRPIFVLVCACNWYNRDASINVPLISAKRYISI